MKAIAAVDSNWGIGKGNELLVSIPADMKNFRALTSGGVVILGRKTLETFPNGMPLKNRTNIMLTTNKNKAPKADEIICNSVDEVLELVKKYEAEGKEVWVIGGDSIYKQLVPYCDTCIITKIDYSYDADAFFPNLDNDESWEVVSTSEEQTYFDLAYEFVEYRKK